MSDHEDTAKWIFPLEAPRTGAAPRSLEIGVDNSLRVEGYAPEDLRGLLAVWREHMELMVVLASGSRDAVRYRPDDQRDSQETHDWGTDGD